MMGNLTHNFLFVMKKLFFILLLNFIFNSFVAQSQSGGACLYMLPGDSTIVCNIYGNGGLPNQVACYNDADAAGAIPMDCYAYLSCAANTYPDLGGNGCFYAGTGSCVGSGSICDLIGLPVELISFEGEIEEDKNILTWTTASEANSDYFEVIIFGDSMETYDRLYFKAAGNSIEIIRYKIVHHNPKKSINYYQLVQYDFDGRYKEYNVITLDNTPKKKVEIKRVNTLGQPVDKYYKGLVIILYDDYTTERVFLR